MTIRSLGSYLREQNAPTRTEGGPIGRFVSQNTRDANALSRDGHLVYALSDVPGGRAGENLIEIMFEDSVWILAEASEVVDLSDEADTEARHSGRGGPASFL